MFKKMINAFRGDKHPEGTVNTLHTSNSPMASSAPDLHDIEKYRNNLKTINYQDLLDFIVQDEIYKIDHDKVEPSNPIVVDQISQEEYNLIEDNDDHYPLSIEEEYKFVLVKKAKPKPTLVMPTKILQQHKVIKNSITVLKIECIDFRSHQRTFFHSYRDDKRA